MTAPLRRGGTGTAPDGSRVVWSVAEGRRGLRWREVRTAPDAGAVLSSLLLETDPEGRFSHTELSTVAGLLTLHPEGDGTLHGNVVSGNGIRHLRGLPWQPDGVLLVEGSAVAQAAAVRLMRRLDHDPSTAIDLGLDLGWRVGDVGGRRLESSVGEDGLPRFADARTWSLEE
jgi:hypothetical protein